jgi:hypothetical protein
MLLSTFVLGVWTMKCFKKENYWLHTVCPSVCPHVTSPETAICTFTNVKVCKSVHHRTIQINHQPDATIFQFIILTFIHSSTCFGRFPAHHQELNDCSGSLWFYLRIVVTFVLCSWSVIELLMMGGKTLKTC